MADEKAEQEHEDTVPARIHEQLRQVMLGERRRAEKAERERDDALVQIGQLNKESRRRFRETSSVTLAAEECGWNGVENPKGLADFIRHLSEERDAALARVRELEAEGEELVALRWLEKWCNSHTSDLAVAVWDSHYHIVEVRISNMQTLHWRGRPLVADSFAALATALDPEWRKAGSKEQDT